MKNILLLILIFFLPFIVFQVGISVFETPKVIVAEILIEIAVIITVFKIQKISPRNLLRLPYILLGSLFLLSLGHVLTSPIASFFGNVFRLQGVFLLWHLLLLTVLFGSTKLDVSYKWAYGISFTLVFLSGLLFGTNAAGRAIGVLGEPNALAATLVIFLPFIFYYHKRPFALLALLMVLVTIYITRSRSAGLAMGVLMMLYILSNLLRVSLSRSTVITGLFILATLVTPFIAYINSLGGTVDPLQIRYEDRSDIWRAALLAGSENPILGNGFGNIQDSIHRASQKLSMNIQFSVIDSSHNFLLDYLIGGGVVGLFLILSLIALTLKNLVIRQQKLELMVFFAAITVMLFNPVSIIVLLMFWWIIGRGLVSTT